MPFDPEVFAILLSAIMAIGLAAACGFRVFVPLLVVALAARAELIELSPGFAWIASTPALVCVALATALEIGAYYVPWLDNTLDAVATPASIVAGIVVAAAVMVDVDPWLRWSTAAIAGGGAAALVQLPTVALRALSSAGTGGVGNPILSSAEAAASAAVASTAALAPLALPVVLVGIALPAGLWVRSRRRRSAPAGAA
jgi:hypothetical protein